MLYKARNKGIKFYNDYSLMISEAKNKATKGTGLKILTPKQMLQRLAPCTSSSCTSKSQQ